MKAWKRRLMGLPETVPMLEHNVEYARAMAPAPTAAPAKPPKGGARATQQAQALSTREYRADMP